MGEIVSQAFDDRRGLLGLADDRNAAATEHATHRAARPALIDYELAVAGSTQQTAAVLIGRHRHHLVGREPVLPGQPSPLVLRSGLGRMLTAPRPQSLVPSRFVRLGVATVASPGATRAVITRMPVRRAERRQGQILAAVRAAFRRHGSSVLRHSASDSPAGQLGAQLDDDA